MRIAAVQAQEPMSGVTIVVGDSGSKAIAARVIASSRELYVAKPKPVEQAKVLHGESKPKLKSRVNQSSQKASEFADIKPLA